MGGAAEILIGFCTLILCVSLSLSLSSPAHLSLINFLLAAAKLLLQFFYRFLAEHFFQRFCSVFLYFSPSFPSPSLFSFSTVASLATSCVCLHCLFVFLLLLHVAFTLRQLLISFEAFASALRCHGQRVEFCFQNVEAAARAAQAAAAAAAGGDKTR